MIYEACDIVLEEAIRRFLDCGHQGMDMVSNNAWVGCRDYNGGRFD